MGLYIYTAFRRLDSKKTVSTRAFVDFLSATFGKAIFKHFMNIGNIEEYIDHFMPDIVTFESAERGLEAFANCVAGIPELP
jgi:hypothetical protein